MGRQLEVDRQLWMVSDCLDGEAGACDVGDLADVCGVRRHDGVVEADGTTGGYV